MGTCLSDEQSLTIWQEIGLSQNDAKGRMDKMASGRLVERCTIKGSGEEDVCGHVPQFRKVCCILPITLGLDTLSTLAKTRLHTMLSC